MKVYGSITNAVRALVAREGGVNYIEATEAVGAQCQRDMSRLLHRMERTGDAVSARVDGITRRYFARQADAQRWLDGNPLLTEKPSRLSRLQVQVIQRVRDGLRTAKEIGASIGVTTAAASESAIRLADRGLLVAKRDGPRLVFFADQTSADAWQPPAKPEKRIRKSEAKPRPAHVPESQRLGRTQFAAIQIVEESAGRGIRARDVAALVGVSPASASDSLRKLTAAKILFYRVHREAFYFFPTQAYADAWEPPVKPKRVHTPRPCRMKVKEEKPAKAPSVTIKNHGRVSPVGEAIIPPHVKPIECKGGYTHNHKYAVAPDLARKGEFEGAGFRGIGIGRYLESEPA